MNKKVLLAIILVLTALAIAIILILKSTLSYNEIIVDEGTWNSIINNRDISTDINLDEIEFNDYNLIIDNESNIIYYSVVDTSKKYNPSIKYKSNQKVSIAVNKNLNDDELDKEDSIKIIIYNDNEYRIYTLIATKYPTLSVTLNESTTNKKKPTFSIELFDNYVDSSQRVLKSDGMFKTIEENKTYSFSLHKQSLGNNKRENNISVFGMEKRNEYILNKEEDTSEDKKYVRVFVNNKYIGIYSLNFRERKINNIERNKEANK